MVSCDVRILIRLIGKFPENDVIPLKTKSYLSKYLTVLPVKLAAKHNNNEGFFHKSRRIRVNRRSFNLLISNGYLTRTLPPNLEFFE